MKLFINATKISPYSSLYDYREWNSPFCAATNLSKAMGTFEYQKDDKMANKK